MDPDSLTPPKRSLLDIGFMLFLRLVALACLIFGIQYWGLLTGYLLGGRARFDLLNLPWKVAASSLAVLFPVAALGLWLTSSWGPVVWVIAAGGQIVMYTVWPEIFGTNWLIVMMNGVIMALYAAFRLSQLIRRRRMRQVRVDSP